MERLVSPFSIDVLIWASGFSVTLVGVALALQSFYQIRIKHRITATFMKRFGVLATSMGTNIAGVAYVVVANERLHVDLTGIARGVETVVSDTGFIVSAGLTVVASLATFLVQLMLSRRRAGNASRGHGMDEVR